MVLAEGLAPSTINLCLSPISKLASEMADNRLLAPNTPAAIERVPGVKQEGVRAGTGCSRSRPANCSASPTPRPSRANAIAPCSRCRSAAAFAAPSYSLTVDQIERREGRCVISDLSGKAIANAP